MVLKKFCFSYAKKKHTKKQQISISKIIVGLQGMDTGNPPFETRTTDSGVFQTPEVAGWLDIMSYMILIFYTAIVLPVVMSVKDWLKKHINKKVLKKLTLWTRINQALSTSENRS